MNKHLSPRRLGMAVLTGGLAFVGSADATELLLDGSFENTVPSSSPIVRVGGKPAPGVGEGWSTFSTYLYSTSYALPGPAGSGEAFLRPYPSGTYGITRSSDSVMQIVSLLAGTTLTAAKIDAGSGRYTMSAWFSGYLTQADFSDLTLEFLNEADATVGDPVLLGGADFVAAIPTGPNAKYTNAKDWARDARTDAIPPGARKARVTVAAGFPRSGAPDGYVDVVSLDVSDAALTVPALVSATPANNAVGAGPVVNLAVTLQDRQTAVDTNTIRLYLDSLLVSPVIQKVETNTTVTYAAGVLPALSSHNYTVIFGDTGHPSSFQTNTFHFTVADYLALSPALSTPLGSEDQTKPGFIARAYQLDALAIGDPAPVQVEIPASMAFAEAVLAGAVGTNVADITNFSLTNAFLVSTTINWANSSGAPANFPGDRPFPGIPGLFGGENSFVHEIQTFLRFPAPGYYQMGINSEDAFRLTQAVAGQQALSLSSPTNLVIPSVPIATNITQLQFGGSLPAIPLTAQVVYATPNGNPDESCDLSANTTLAGKIALLDRGSTGCDSATKALQAQLVGALAVLETTPGDTGYPFRLDDINPDVHIPVLVIAEEFGGSLLKSLLLSGKTITATIQADTNLRIAEWDGPKGFGAVDVLFGFAVPSAGVYPLRLVTTQTSGAANLEWYSIQPDGSKVLINDTTNPNAIRAFYARSEVVERPKFNPVALTGGNISLAWTGAGTLQESTSLTGEWTDSPNQANPQTVTAAGPQKFYRIRH